jgi:hypothetical protein
MVRGLVLAILIAACSSGGHGPAGPTPGSGSAGSAVAAPAVITDAAGIAANLGKHVALRGTARDARLSAVVMIEGSPIYCLGVDTWPAAISGKEVTAHGTLESSHQFEAKPGPNGEISQGTDGPVTVLRDCAYDAP